MEPLAMTSRNQIAIQQHYTEITRLSSRLKRDKSSLNYTNRAFEYLEFGDFEHALADFQAAEDVEECKSDAYLQWIGLVHWLARRKKKAIEVWLKLVLETERGRIAYTDAAGGVEIAHLLWFAAVRQKRKDLLAVARRLLKKKVGQKPYRCCSIENWPGPISLYLLGRLKENRLLSEVEDIAVVREDDLCQAKFYIGVRALQAGKKAEARKHFERAADLGRAGGQNEYYLARNECRPRLSKRGN
jgi:tetratricopeptide (TPR) repeat protein